MIKSKYNLGDKVWLIEKNQVVEKTIYGIIQTKVPSETICYFLELQERIMEHMWQSEETLFSSKEELIKSLSEATNF